jgi:beta-glucosidase
VAAKHADAVIAVVGLTPEWESEGFDRPTLHLPGLQDELIEKVAQVNKQTIVAIQCVSDSLIEISPLTVCTVMFRDRQ